MSKRVLSIVVSYNPELIALQRTLHALVEQGSDVLVVDNCSADVTSIQTLSDSLSRVSILCLASNLGLGAAHNLGILHAEKHGYERVLLMDQDSQPLAAMLPSLNTALDVKMTKGKTCAVGATYLNADNGTESFFVKFGALKFQRQYCGVRDADGCIAADFLISSGSLIDLSVIKEIGQMDEDLFIDHIDTEWFLRARYKGFQAFGVCDAIMQHGLGEQTHRVSLGGRQRNVPQHKPFRYYYIFRNSVLLYKRAYTSNLWKWNDIQRLAMIATMFGLFKAPRRENLAMMIKGVWHGFKGVTGPLNV